MGLHLNLVSYKHLLYNMNCLAYSSLFCVTVKSKSKSVLYLSKDRCLYRGGIYAS